jgi:outer membrane protein OmpA-like peptidoglycan-associated protein
VNIVKYLPLNWEGQKMNKSIAGSVFFGLVLSIGAPVMAQETAKSAQSDSAKQIELPAGKKVKVRGVIVRRDPDSFVMRDLTGGELTVNLQGAPEVTEKKSNPFRRAKNYGTTVLLRGAVVEVEGKGNGNTLSADKIRMTDNAVVVAQSVESRVTPVEGRVGETETRITQAEANAQRLSGQLDELTAISNAARGGAKAAQETADMAVAGVEATNKRIDTLVSSLDEYEAKRGITVNFKVGSSKLQPEATTALDELATQAKTEKAYVIEITGFASADGSTNLNRRLSQQRADAVVRYLAENHNIPLRRLVTPFGYGETNPVADNETRDGREQNRRVEVKILVNKGLVAPPAPVQMKPTSTSE